MYAQIVTHKEKKWKTHRTVTAADTISDVSSAPSDASDLSERNMIVLFADVPGSGDSVTLTVVGFPEGEGEGVQLWQGTLNAELPSGTHYTTELAKVDTYACKKFIAYVTAASDFGTGITLKYGEL